MIERVMSGKIVVETIITLPESVNTDNLLVFKNGLFLPGNNGFHYLFENNKLRLKGDIGAATEISLLNLTDNRRWLFVVGRQPKWIIE